MGGQVQPVDDDRTPRIVVGVDGSPGSRTALVWALNAATRRAARLEVLGAFPVDVYWTDALLADPRRLDLVRSHTEDACRAIIEEARSDPAAAGTETTRVDLRLLPGPAAEQLVQQSRGAALLVVGSRGRSGVRSTLLGSVALHCAAHASCPVVVVHPAEPAAEAPVVVGFEDSPVGRHALRAALDEGRRLGADVEVVTALLPSDWEGVPPSETADDVEEARQQAEQRTRGLVDGLVGAAGNDDGGRPGVRVAAVEGFVTDVLIARARNARLLVVGSRSRSTLVGMTLGSVALHCVVYASCPVMVVRPEPDQPDAAAAAASTEHGRAPAAEAVEASIGARHA